MAVTVRIPTQLRQLTGGVGEVSVDATTVGEALQSLDLESGSLMNLEHCGALLTCSSPKRTSDSSRALRRR